MDSGKIKKLHIQILEFYVTHKRKVTFVSIKDQIIGYMNEFSWAIDIWRECNKLLTWHEKKIPIPCPIYPSSSSHFESARQKE